MDLGSIANAVLGAAQQGGTTLRIETNVGSFSAAVKLFDPLGVVGPPSVPVAGPASFSVGLPNMLDLFQPKVTVVAGGQEVDSFAPAGDPSKPWMLPVFWSLVGGVVILAGYGAYKLLT